MTSSDRIPFITPIIMICATLSSLGRDVVASPSQRCRISEAVRRPDRHPGLSQGIKPGRLSQEKSQVSGHGSKAGYSSGWLGSTPGGRRPQIRGLRAGGSLAIASSTPATQLLSPARVATLNRAGVRTLGSHLSTVGQALVAILDSRCLEDPSSK